LRTLALKGRHFETWEQVCDAVAMPQHTGMLIVILSFGDEGGVTAPIVYLEAPSQLLFVDLVDVPLSLR